MREMVTGRAAPSRSVIRPAAGDSAPSTAAAHKNVAAIPAPEAPSRANRSGASTSITPNAIPGSIISHMPDRTCRSRSAGSNCRRPCEVAATGGRGRATE